MVVLRQLLVVVVVVVTGGAMVTIRVSIEQVQLIKVVLAELLANQVFKIQVVVVEQVVLAAMAAQPVTPTVEVVAPELQKDHRRCLTGPLAAELLY
jgi:hypothetical protein